MVFWSSMKAIIVVPTIREASIFVWLKKWSKEFSGQTIIIVEDNPSRTFHVPVQKNLFHYAWDDINKELGEKSWVIPRRSGAIRSFGFYKAYQQNPDMVVGLDDDCYPDHKNFLGRHWQALQKEQPLEWFQHFPGMRVRGLPYNLDKAPTVFNMGLWSNVPDLDGKTQLEFMDYRSVRSEGNYVSPRGYFSPISSMNVAFKPEATVAFYQLLMGEGYEYHRFDDIWGGIFLKKICDHLGLSVSGGTPYIQHDRASDPNVNIIKEKPGLETNERLWLDVKKITLSGSDFKSCYISLAEQLPEYSPYWIKLKTAMITWANLF